ncbi:hypothetical protein AB0H83_35095 [Dactylosporangium sp. NPDC050688]|uniref:hypothetical protein n=1 Tax=Dactylosporangium sp. NPDC050688 TaxID=3157217 RepID=UPI00340D668F
MAGVQQRPACGCRQLTERTERAERAEARLGLLRRQLRDAVVAGDLDADFTNDPLAAADLPLLPRRWTVNLPVTLNLTVVADSSDDAFDAARNTVDGALFPAGVGYDERDAGAATPGDVVDDPIGA